MKRLFTLIRKQNLKKKKRKKKTTTCKCWEKAEFGDTKVKAKKCAQHHQSNFAVAFSRDGADPTFGRVCIMITEGSGNSQTAPWFCSLLWLFTNFL
jgi:hypothetical protein